MLGHPLLLLVPNLTFVFSSVFNFFPFFLLFLLNFSSCSLPPRLHCVIHRLLLNRFYDAKQNEGKPEKVVLNIYNVCNDAWNCSLSYLRTPCHVCFTGETTLFGLRV